MVLGLLSLIASVCVLAFAASPASAGTAYRYDNNLRWWVHNSLEAASETDLHGKTIPKTVEVRCYTSAASFARDAYRSGYSLRTIPSLIAYFDARWRNSIMMRNKTCQDATRFTNGVYTAVTLGAFKTLLHEALHRQGFINEHYTELYALASMRDATQLAQFNVFLSRGATDENAAWEAARPYAEQAQRVAWEQSVRATASRYHTQWSEVVAATENGWAEWLGK
jgi:hypothetical protein